MAQRSDRFDGAICGFGTASGTRLVLGMWDASPFGPVADAMIERPDGHRVLVAPTSEVGEYIVSTYRFDEVRIEPTHLIVIGSRRVLRSHSLRAEVVVAGRTPVGRLLRCVPPLLATSPRWVRAIDPVATRVRDGVHTVGTAGGGRQEFYCARDEHTLGSVHAELDGAVLGALAPVLPPVRFGFGSTPARPSLVHVTTLITRA